MRHLIVNLQAPMMVFFGSVRVDRYGATNPFPTTSTLTGMLGNALGYERRDIHDLQALQDRLIHASRIDRANSQLLREYQTASIRKGERAWTATGTPEVREGGDQYRLQQMWQDYLQDARITVALRLEPDDARPDLDDIAQALRKPERPLFIGKKHCIPTAPMMAGFQEADSVLEAVALWPMEEEGEEQVRVCWPPREGWDNTHGAARQLQDLRNWAQGIHGGEQTVLEGTIPRETFPRREESKG